MKLSKRLKILKYLVYLYIIILSITGLGQTILGGILLWNHLGYNLIVENNFYVPTTILLCLGPLSILLCWLGWKANNERRRFLLGLFSAFLIVLISIQLFLCGWCISLRETLPRSAERFVDDSFEYFLSQSIKFDQSHKWNRLQADLKCCGVDGPSDYRRGASAVPWSCCSGSDNPEDSACTSLYQRGCLFVLSHDTRKRLLHCGLVSLTIALIQSIGLFCSIHLIILLGEDANSEVDTISSAIPFSEAKRNKKELIPLSNGQKQKKQQNHPHQHHHHQQHKRQMSDIEHDIS